MRSASPYTPGKITAVIGPNGAGKTTAINCISGIYRPDAGIVTYQGEEINKVPTHKLAQSGLTRTFQNLQVFTSLSVLENIMVGMHAKPGREFVACIMRAGFAGREERIIKEKSMAVLEFLGMADLAHMPADSFPMATANGLRWPGRWSANPNWCSWMNRWRG
jgi:branched-chain amino acid transport system ATP-binding protein